MSSLFLYQDPNHTALDDFSRQLSWKSLEDDCYRTAHCLLDHFQLEDGDHIALFLGNRVEFISALLGGILAGLWVTPVNRHLKPDEIQHIIKDSGARLVISDKPLACDVPVIDLEAFNQLLPMADHSPMDPGSPPGGTMFYTSGTTGKPKGVKRKPAATMNDYLDTCRNFANSVALDGNGPHLLTGPLYHAAPMLLALYDLFNGAPMIIMPRWDNQQFLDTCIQRQIKHSHLVPTLFERLLRLPEKEKQAFAEKHTLVSVIHGAAPVAPHTKEAMIRWWGPVLFEYWGGTEAGITTFCNSADWLAHPGTVGQPLPQFDVFACGDNSMQALPSGETGVLYARHKHLDQVFSYHNDEAKTAAAHPTQNTFTLGDMGYVDNKGFVFLTDRKHNMIISGGVNIYPAEIEACLKKHPMVLDAAVFGEKDAEWGENVCACIEVESLVEDATSLEDALRDHASNLLANYKVPRKFFFTDNLPRNPAGKIRVNELKQSLEISAWSTV